MDDFEKYLNKQMEDPGFRAEYEALEPEFAIISAIVDARKDAGLTQKQLSQRAGIGQADISKIEKGVANPSLKTLKRLAEGMGMVLKLEFLPASQQLPRAAKSV